MRDALSTIPHLLTNNPAVRSFLGLLLVADLLFLVLNFVPAPPPLDRGQLLLDRDLGFSETFQYLKSFWIAVLLVALALRTRYGGYLVWTVLFLYLLLDDMLAIHEWFGYQWRLRQATTGSTAQEVGELIWMLLVIVVALFLVALSHWQGDRTYRAATLPLLLLAGAMTFFGLVVDKLHGMVGWSQAMGIFVGTIEDWGEMVVMSLIVAYTLSLYVQGGRTEDRALPDQ